MDVVPLLALVAGAVAAIALLDVVIRRTAVGFVLVVVPIVHETLLFGVDLRLALGPFSVYPADVVFALLGAAAAARLLRSRRVHPLQVLVLAFLVLSLWSIVRGVPLHGADAALNEARKYLSYSAAVLYFSTMPVARQEADRFVPWWLALASYLLVIALTRWVAFFAGLHDLFPDADSLRVLDSFDTVVLVTGFLLAAGPLLRERSGLAPTGPPPSRARLELFLIASFLAIVLLQHRTLWIALVMGVALLSARDPRLTGRLIVATVLAGVVVSVATIAVFGQGVEEIVVDDLSASATEADTFEWRVAGWRRLLETSMPGTPDELLLGQPFGGGFDRYLGGQRVTVSPHNFPLESFLRVGVLGAGAFVLLHAVVIARLYPSGQRIGSLRRDALAVAVGVLFLYYLTSHPHPEHGALTGYAVAHAMDAVRRRTGSGTRAQLEVAA